ncbi:MAG: murein biosynthesis integral membrane protein MurJ [Actinomycetota bacterium]|nr:murein biosynthesis integral membrane protein MurJ [Actinomycetota bacterium]
MVAGKQAIAKATIIIIAGNILSSVLGFVRETVIAFQFGATAKTDAFLIAYIVPGAIVTLVASSISIGFIPVFTEWRIKRGEDESWRVASAFINVLLVFLSVVALINVVLSGVYIPILSPGLASWAKDLAVDLTRLMSPVIILTGLVGISTSIMNAYRHFTYPALASSLYNIGIIGGALLLARYFGIAGLAVGMIAGTLGQLIVQSIPLRKFQGNYRLRRSDIAHPAVKRIAFLILPLAVGSIATNFSIIVNRVLASQLAEGSISALNFATLVMHLPVGIFTMAVVTVIYPALSQYVAEDNIEGLRTTFSEGLRMLWLVIVPISLALMLFSRPVIQLLFEHGAFDKAATELTSTSLMYLSIGIFAYTGTIMLFRMFSSMQDTRTPVVAGVLSMAINILLSLVLVRVLGLAGIAIANSVAANINFLLLACKLRQKLGFIDGARIAIATAKIGFSSVVTLALCWIIFTRFILQNNSMLFNYEFMQLGSIACVGAIVYIILGKALRIEELAKLRAMWMSK